MDDVAALVTTTLVAKGTEALVSGGTSAVRALVALLRKRFGRDTDEAELMYDAVAHPDDPTQRAKLIALLTDEMRRDPTFAEDLRQHWRWVSAEMSADNGSVINQFNGQAERVIQARDIHGVISL
jgi:hypothetical protein